MARIKGGTHTLKDRRATFGVGRGPRNGVSVSIVASLILSGLATIASSTAAIADAGTITTVATQLSPIGSPMTSLATAEYVGHDALGSLYLDLGSDVGKAAVGGTLSIADVNGYMHPATAGPLATAGPDGGVYFSSQFRIFRAGSNGNPSVPVAGTGVFGSSGDGGQATAADITPRAFTIGPDGSIYIAEGLNSASSAQTRIRKVSPSGIISTIAGTGVQGDSGDGASALVAQIDAYSLDVDGAGRIVFL